MKILLPLCQLHTCTACLYIQNGVWSSFTNRKHGSALSVCFDISNFFFWCWAIWRNRFHNLFTSSSKQFTLFMFHELAQGLMFLWTSATSKISICPVGTTGPISGGSAVWILWTRHWIFLIWTWFNITSVILCYLKNEWKEACYWLLHENMMKPELEKLEPEETLQSEL